MGLFAPGTDGPRPRRVTRSERREEAREGWPLSLWRDTNRRFHFPSPVTDIGCDVLVVGAGLSGLWTAHHLLRLDPSLQVVIVDAMQPGYGASGRNGGWCSALLPMSPRRTVSLFGPEGASDLRRAMESTVTDIGTYVAESASDAGWVMSGSLTVATNEHQAERLRAGISEWHESGATGVSWLGAGELLDRVRIPGALGGLLDPHCAVLNPYRLVDRLVQDAVDAGVRIFGDTRAVRIGNGFAEVRSGDGICFVTAERTVVATEAFTTRLPGHARSSAPVYSYVIATDPLPDDVWDAIGWDGREALAEGTHMVSYAQRTADGRILMGGRGAPYAFGSDIHAERDTHRRVHARLEENLRRLFPAASRARVSHRWGGAVAVPRDWRPSVRTDDRSGAILLGGYAGDGVTLSHLAARIAAHRVVGVDSPCLSLPINEHPVRKWEPEPLRWAGINAGLTTTRMLDARESSGRKPGRVLGRAARLLGD